MRIHLQAGQPGSLSDTPQLLAIAQVFLSEQMGAKYYGPGLRFVVLDFRCKLPKGRVPRTVWRYRGSFAEHLLVEVPGFDLDNMPPSVASLRQILDQTLRSIVQTQDFWQGEFRVVDFESDFTACLAIAPQTDDELRQYVSRLGEAREHGKLRVLEGDEEHRRQTPRPCDTSLAGLRCYDHGYVKGLLNPQLAIQWRLVEGLLRNLKFKCPGYREIYINIAPTLEAARRHRTAIEDWHENAYATISSEEYERASHEERAELVLTAIETALCELAQIDHLDIDLIRQAVQQARITGTQTDIEYLSAKNKRYDASVFYRVAEDGGDPHFRLVVVDKVTKRTATIDLGRRDLWWLPYHFGRLSLRAQDVRIEGRNSERARVARNADHLPEELVFAYREIFPNKEQ